MSQLREFLVRPVVLVVLALTMLVAVVLLIFANDKVTAVEVVLGFFAVVAGALNVIAVHTATRNQT